MKKWVAITGGIGSGKSTAIAIIAKMGYPVFSCDELYKEILLEKEYVKEIEGQFDGVVKKGVIDKRALSALVFSDDEMRKRLETLAHPRIMQRLFEKMQNSNAELVFAEVPLLFEGGYEKDFDAVLVIMREVEQRIAAVCNRDGGTRAQALQKMAAQFDYEKATNFHKLQNQNVTLIHNNLDVSCLHKQLSDCIKAL